jgi:hypothetical protein
MRWEYLEVQRPQMGKRENKKKLINTGSMEDNYDKTTYYEYCLA